MHKIVILPQNAEVWLPAGTSLTELEFELHGQESVAFGCKAGACGACVIEVVEGLPHLGARDGPESEFLEALGYPGDEFRLACQCRLNGEVRIRAAVRT